MDYKASLKHLSSKLNETELHEIATMRPLERLDLANLGSNDIEGYQVFTPRFIVEQMSDAIGPDMLNFKKTVLEPTSGDGAFTTYILAKRLETITDDFELNALRALSTIYSTEMDKELIKKQRDNILTVLRGFFASKEMVFEGDLLEVFKIMVFKNFVWAMFNSEDPITMLLPIVMYKMPDAEQGNFKSLDFPVWEINEDRIMFHEEGIDVEW